MAKRKAKKGNNLIIYIYIPIIATIAFILYFFANSSFNIKKGSPSNKGPVSKHIPSKLKWNDSFKGISNHKSKKKQQEEKPKNFINFK